MACYPGNKKSICNCWQRPTVFKNIEEKLSLGQVKTKAFSCA
jgi:hypothetical protein